MDPATVLSVTASIITCVDLIGKLLKKLGRFDHSRGNLNRMLKIIYGFKGAFENLKAHLEFNEEDGVRFSALKQFEELLGSCSLVLSAIETRLESVDFVGRFIVGKLWDKKFQKWITDLDDAKELFNLALSADQQILLSAIERYIRNSANDLRDIQSSLIEDGNRAIEHYDLFELKQQETGESIRQVHDSVTELSGSAMRHYHDINETTCKVGSEVLEFSKGWKAQLEKMTKNEECDLILKWLSQTDPSTNHNAALEKHEPTTGDWFAEGEKYTEWKEARSSFLWLYGFPRCGKTILY